MHTQDSENEKARLEYRLEWQEFWQASIAKPDTDASVLSSIAADTTMRLSATKRTTAGVAQQDSDKHNGDHHAPLEPIQRPPRMHARILRKTKTGMHAFGWRPRLQRGCSGVGGPGGYRVSKRPVIRLAGFAAGHSCSRRTARLLQKCRYRLNVS